MRGRGKGGGEEGGGYFTCFRGIVVIALLIQMKEGIRRILKEGRRI